MSKPIRILKGGPEGVEIYKWMLNAAQPTGKALDVRSFSSIEIQIKGTWNTGTVTIRGGYDGANFLGLRNESGVAISHTADPATLIALFESPAFIYPTMATPGTDAVEVTAIARK